MRSQLLLLTPLLGWMACNGAVQDGESTYKTPPLTLPADPANYAPLEKYQAMTVPADNPMSAAKATLGWQLFFDTRLSGDGKLSCYSCHVNEHGLTDGKALGQGAFGKPLTRSAPTLWNIGFHEQFYWDGRADSLEKQAMAAWKGVNMGAKDSQKDAIREDILKTLNGLEGYRRQFQQVFAQEATAGNVAKALACYMRTIISKTTAFDQWQAGDERAVSETAKRGFATFKRAKCDGCHGGFLLTDQQFHNVGIGMDKPNPDLGRFAVTKRDMDRGAFKTPTLRDVARSAPYFHDGSAQTLEEVVRLMASGGIENPYLDRTNLQKADLSEADLADIVEFLKTLSETAELKTPPLPK